MRNSDTQNTIASTSSNPPPPSSQVEATAISNNKPHHQIHAKCQSDVYRELRKHIFLGNYNLFLTCLDNFEDYCQEKALDYKHTLTLIAQFCEKTGKARFAKKIKKIIEENSEIRKAQSQTFFASSSDSEQEKISQPTPLITNAESIELSFHVLPNEMLATIYSHLPYNDQIKLAQSSKHLHHLHQGFNNYRLIQQSLDSLTFTDTVALLKHLKDLSETWQSTVENASLNSSDLQEFVTLEQQHQLEQKIKNYSHRLSQTPMTKADQCLQALEPEKWSQLPDSNAVYKELRKKALILLGLSVLASVILTSIVGGGSLYECMHLTGTQQDDCFDDVKDISLTTLFITLFISIAAIILGMIYKPLKASLQSSLKTHFGELSVDELKVSDKIKYQELVAEAEALASTKLAQQDIEAVTSMLNLDDTAAVNLAHIQGMLDDIRPNNSAVTTMIDHVLYHQPLSPPQKQHRIIEIAPNLSVRSDSDLSNSGSAPSKQHTIIDMSSSIDGSASDLGYSSGSQEETSLLLGYSR